MSSILDGLVSSEVEKSPDATIMDFKIEKSALSRALNATLPVIPNKDLQPLLRNFHFRLEGIDLRVTGSDSVLTALHHEDVLMSNGSSGTAVFPPKRLSVIASEAPGEIHFKVVRKKGKYTATIKSGSASWTIPLMDPAGYPDFSKAEEEKLNPVERQPFLAALQRVRKAVSTDEMRPYLMLIDLSGGRMRASDSIRFQQTEYEFPFECQIPFRAAHEVVQRLSASNSETIEVGQTKSALIYRFGKSLLVAQKVVAKFPDVDEVLLKPTFSNDLLLKVNRQELLSAVRRVRVTADEGTSAVVLSLNHGSVSVESKDRKGSVSVEEVPAEWEHAPRHVSFNHNHLTDLLSSSDTDTCVFRLGKDLKTKPTAFLMEDEAEGFTAVLSQIRLDWM